MVLKVSTIAATLVVGLASASLASQGISTPNATIAAGNPSIDLPILKGSVPKNILIAQSDPLPLCDVLASGFGECDCPYGPTADPNVSGGSCSPPPQQKQ